MDIERAASRAGVLFDSITRQGEHGRVGQRWKYWNEVQGVTLEREGEGEGEDEEEADEDVDEA